MKFLFLIPWLLFICGAGLAHWRVLSPLSGFILVLLSIPAGLAVVVAALWFWIRGTPISYGVVVCLLAILPGALIVFAGRDAFRVPRINDVSTDLEHPPQFTAIAALPENEGRDLSYPESFVPVVRDAYPDLSPGTWPKDRMATDRLFDAAVTVAEGLSGWTVIRADPESKEIEAVVASSLFRFRDYVSIRISGTGESIRVDIRSKSRDGKSDLGVNARRIRTFLAALSAEITM
ncbi:MAG: DUF1499 domain-containing protein [Candidatus Hydrogenedentes bacterium]|nr:DUF1499 domain-containing protein [Candidatus Hydrogenedentota bacterium]